MERRNNMPIIIMFILYVILASSGLVLFKLGSANANLKLIVFNMDISYSVKTIIGLLCYMCSFILWMLIVSKADLTFAMPLSVALVNTLVVIESIFLLKEKITITQGIGIFIVIIGVCIMTIGRNQ